MSLPGRVGGEVKKIQSNDGFISVEMEKFFNWQ